MSSSGIDVMDSADAKYPASMSIDKMEIKNEANRGLVWALLEKGRMRDAECIKAGTRETGQAFRQAASRVADTEIFFRLHRAKIVFGPWTEKYKFIELFFGKPDTEKQADPESGVGESSAFKEGSVRGNETDTDPGTAQGIASIPLQTSVRPPEVRVLQNARNSGLYHFLLAEARRRDAISRETSTKDWSSVGYYKAARSVQNTEIHIWNMQLAMEVKDIGKAIGANIKENFFTPMALLNRKHRLPTEDLEDEAPELKK